MSNLSIKERQNRAKRKQRQINRRLKSEAINFSKKLWLWRFSAAATFAMIVVIFFASINPHFHLISFSHTAVNTHKQTALSLPKANNKTAIEIAKLNKTAELNRQVMSIVKNTPMEVMAKDISQKDRAVAAFIVGIAMKESKFGKYAPKKDGVECYNYWGYRGKENTTASGYSCFDSPAHAINVVGGRIDSIVKRGVKTPAQMISWKCGSTCEGHDPESVTKWISDVAINYYKLNPANPKELAKKN